MTPDDIKKINELIGERDRLFHVELALKTYGVEA